MTPEEECLGPNPLSCQDFQSLGPPPSPPPPARISSVPSVGEWGGGGFFSGITQWSFFHFVALYCLYVRKLTSNHRDRFVACVLCYFKMFQIFFWNNPLHSKVQVFLNQPWRQMHSSLILLFWQNKSCLERMPPGKKPAILRIMLIVENKRETSEQK